MAPAEFPITQRGRSGGRGKTWGIESRISSVPFAPSGGAWVALGKPIPHPRPQRTRSSGGAIFYAPSGRMLDFEFFHETLRHRLKAFRCIPIDTLAEPSILLSRVAALSPTQIQTLCACDIFVRFSTPSLQIVAHAVVEIVKPRVRTHVKTLEGTEALMGELQL